MTWDTFSAAIGVAATSIAGVVWGVRQEGRINEHDRLFEERANQETERQQHLNERHTDIKDRLERIENKLDRLNGAQPHV